MSKRHVDANSDASTLAAYLRQIAKVPLLTIDEEQSLGRRIQVVGLMEAHGLGSEPKSSGDDIATCAEATVSAETTI